MVLYWFYVHKCWILLVIFWNCVDPNLGTTSHPVEVSANDDLVQKYFSKPPSSLSVGGRASDQPKRTPVSEEEIEAIMVHGVIPPFILWIPENERIYAIHPNTYLKGYINMWDWYRLSEHAQLASTKHLKFWKLFILL